MFEKIKSDMLLEIKKATRPDGSIDFIKMWKSPTRDKKVTDLETLQTVIEVLEERLQTAPLAYAVFNSEGKIKDVGFDKKKLSGKWGLSYDFGKDWKVKPVRLVEEKL